MKHLVLILLATISLVGCVSNVKEPNPKPQPVSSNSSAGTTFAKLEKTKLGYEFTSFALNSADINTNEPWVNLLEHEPTWNTSDESCLTGLADEGIHCKTADEKLFRFDGTMTAKQAAAWGALTVMSFGLWATMPPDRVIFDRALYESAYEEAYEKFRNELGADPKEMMIETTDSIRALAVHFKNISYDIDVNNNTGFEFNHAGHQSLGVSTSLRPQRIYSNTLELKNYISFLKKVASTETDFKQVFTVACPKQSFGRFSIEIECGGITFDKRRDRVVADVKVDVKGKGDFYLYPKNLQASDKTLEAYVNSDTISFINKSSEYISLVSFSFYYKNDISTYTWQQPLPLPPNSNKTIRLTNLIPDLRSKLHYVGFSESIENKIDLQYGIAALYIANGQQKTVIAKKNYHTISAAGY